MLACSDKIKIFSFNLIHHRIHFRKTHYACNNITSDHKRRYTICKTSVDHKIAGIRYHCRMQSCYISHKIIKTVSCNFSRTVKINAVKRFHNLCVIRNFKIRNYRLSKTLEFYILTVIFSNRNRRIDNIRNGHHDFLDFFFNFFFFYRQLLDSSCAFTYFFLKNFCFFKFFLSHHCSDFF